MTEQELESNRMMGKSCNIEGTDFAVMYSDANLRVRCDKGSDPYKKAVICCIYNISITFKSIHGLNKMTLLSFQNPRNISASLSSSAYCHVRI